MIVDSSALVTAVFREPGSDLYFEAMLDHAEVRIPAPTLVETSMVVSRLADGPHRLAGLLDAVGVRVVDFTTAHADRAVAAFAVYGRGSGHRARLNFGDCLVYAVATVEGEPLLFKGDDFTHTDVVAALGSVP